MFSLVNKFFNNVLNILKGRKKFISCEWLEHGIIFDHANIIRVCCEQSHEGKGRFVLDDSFNGIWLDTDKIIKEKKKLRNIIRKGEIPDSCKGCHFLKSDYWDDEDYFDRILLTHWTKCNTNCIYCPAVRDNNLSKDDVYNIIPIIEQLLDEKLIKSDARFSIAGGEATIYPEFDKLLYGLMEYNFKNININTSGVKFSPSISEAVSGEFGEVVISLDCGNSFLHKRIKGSETFDLVINNIKRYLDAEPVNEARVIVKYILLKGINDNNKEILDWFMLCKNLGVKKLALDIDIAWYREIERNVPAYVKDLILFTKNLSKINNIPLDLYDRAAMVYKSLKIDRKKH